MAQEKVCEACRKPFGKKGRIAKATWEKRRFCSKLCSGAGLARKLAGEKFGRLTAIRRVQNSENGLTQWFCVCDCGETKIAATKTLVNGGTMSCGCLHLESAMNKVRQNEKPLGTERVHLQTGRIEIKTENGFRLKHRVVMEKYLGRTLDETEVVHHIDENNRNNHISNLELMLHGQHTVFHHTGAKRSGETRSKIKEKALARSRANQMGGF